MLASVMQMQLLPAVLALAAFLVAILLTLYIVRMLFGRRIRVAGGRNRPKRLDIVDAFDLDRERQLVIVRRDNVEHLLLIGGPTDVLIEASFERPAGLQAETKPEGREPRLSAPSPSWPSPPEGDEEAEEAPLAARGAAARIPSPSPGPREAPAAAPLSVEGLRRRFSEPPRPAPRPPEPPRAAGAPPAPGARPLAPQPGRMGPPPPPRGPEPPQGEGAPAPGRPAAPTDQPLRPAAPPPGLGPRPAAPTRPGAPPPLGPRPPRPAPPPAAPAPAPAETPPQEPAPGRRESLESLESLEAEMARLLGRPEGQ